MQTGTGMRKTGATVSESVITTMNKNLNLVERCYVVVVISGRQ